MIFSGRIRRTDPRRVRLVVLSGLMCCGLIACTKRDPSLAPEIPDATPDPPPQGPGWVWQHPLPQGGTYVALTFVDDVRGYALTQGGALLESLDAGRSWDVISVSMPRARSAEIWDAENILVVTHDSKIYRTHDGGAHWELQFESSTVAVERTAFFDRQTGIALEAGQFSRTDDGGQTWQEGDYGIWPRKRVYGAAFASRDVLVVVGLDGWILRTTDGGRNWTRIPSPTTEDLYSVRFVSSTDGYAVGHGGTILKTTDGGVSWTTRQSHTTWGLGAIAIADSNRLWAGGSGVRIVHTIDAGESWDLQPVEAYGSVYFMEASSPASVTAVGGLGLLLHSEGVDGSWEDLQERLPGRLEAVSFTSKFIGAAVGPDGTILWTDDAGRTWIGQDAGTTAWLHDVEVVDSQTAYAVGNHVVLKTTDAGRSWQSLPIGGEEDFRAVSFVSPQLGVIAGGRGVMLITRDGGSTWEGTASGSGDWIQDVAFSDPWTVTAVTMLGSVLRSNDGGVSWVQRELDGIRELTCLSVVDDQVAFAAGTKVMYRTDDGGQSWKRLENAQDIGYRGISFANERVGTAVGMAGSIVRTTDGGRTWFAQASGAFEHLQDVTLLDEETAVAVGLRGAILRTEDGGGPAAFQQFR